jgi:hypothetical protein
MTKPKQMIIAGALILLLVSVAGTYAWTNFNNGVVNEFAGSDEKPGGTTHDDLDNPNKDVYVENWGNVPIFIRIRLSEYMEIGNNAGKDTTDKQVTIIGPGNPILTDRKTWKTHVPYNGDVTIGDGGDSFSQYWKWKMGGQKWYMPVSDANKKDGYIDQNKTVYTGTEPGVKQTQNAVVITMAEWIAQGKQIGDFWVGDTDGWFYWASPLAPGSATGLLLDSVSKLKDITGDLGGSYYYAIYVTTQMATAFSEGESPDDYTNFGDSDNGGWTDEGEDLLDVITGGDRNKPSSTPTPTPSEAPSAPSPTEVPAAPSPTEVPAAPSPTEAPVAPSPTEAPSPTPTPAILKLKTYFNGIVDRFYDIPVDGQLHIIEIPQHADTYSLLDISPDLEPDFQWVGGPVYDYDPAPDIMDFGNPRMQTYVEGSVGDYDVKVYDAPRNLIGEIKIRFVIVKLK